MSNNNTRRSATKLPKNVEPLTEAGRLRERVKRHLVQKFYTRFHMSLILASCGAAAMLANWSMLRLGVTAMYVRYPIAVTLAYLTFLAGVWLWLQYMGNRYAEAGKRSSFDGVDVVDAANLVPNFGGGSASAELPLPAGAGGAFDGGGAAGEWTSANPAHAFAGSHGSTPSSEPGIFSSIGDKLGDFCSLDGEGLVLVVLALVLIFSLLLLGGYVVWFAPDILGEAIFGATLAGTLARTAKNNDESGWILGVMKKTWWPFAIVFAAAMAFAIYAAIHYPQAATFGGAVQLALSGQ